MNQSAYKFGVALALADAGLLKNAAESPQESPMPQGSKKVPAELLAAKLRNEPDMAPTEQAEADTQPETDYDFNFNGVSSYTPLANMGLDFRAPVDTSV